VGVAFHVWNVEPSVVQTGARNPWSVNVGGDTDMKEEMFPELFCEECLTDKEIKCKRDKDVKCLHCGAELCAYHMAKHLEKEHCVSTTWKGVGTK